MIKRILGKLLNTQLFLSKGFYRVSGYLLAIPNRSVMSLSVTSSVVLHIVLLAFALITFVAPRLIVQVPLEVVLLNARSDEAPKHAQAYGQSNMRGGGEDKEGIKRAPTLAAKADQDGDALVNARLRQLVLEFQAKELLATLKQQEEGENPATQTGQSSGKGDNTIESHALQRREIAIDRRLSDYQAQPRIHFFRPSVAEHRFARYVEAWRLRVEQVGNQNYPQEAMGRIYGKLVMTVTLSSDGHVLETRINKSSGHAALDQAARRIVRIGEPYAAFDDELRRDTDRLVITRTWRFQQQNTQLRLEESSAAESATNPTQ